MDRSTDEEAYLELDDEPPALADPTPELPAVGDDEAFLEVLDEAPGAGPRVLTDDDLAAVNALGDDALPLLAALWPGRAALLREVPVASSLSARLDELRRALNQVTRRGPEWRARAEVAAAALARRLDAMPQGPALLPAALAQLESWTDLQLAERIRAESAADRSLREPELQRLRAWCDERGVDPARIDLLAERAKVAVHHGASAAWTALDALPDAPRSLDAAALALTAQPAQAVAALRAGAVSAWLRANRAPEGLCEVADAAEAACAAREELEGPATVAVWSLAWAMGLDGATVHGLLVTTPDTLRAHLRGRRIDGQRLRAAAPVLAAWFSRAGAPGLARALQRLAEGAAEEESVSWALGEPLRLGDRSAADPAHLAREVLQRSASRLAAERRLRDGSLVAWLDTLPSHRRDPAWHDALARAEGDLAREAAFWPGIYRRAPRAPLRLPLDDEARRTVRFESPADLMHPARVAAAWVPLRAAWRRGELGAWLAAAAPGIELDQRPELPEDHGLHALLWSLGASVLVLPWGRAGLPAVTPDDLVEVWRRGPAQLESLLPQGIITLWLRRFHPHVGAPAVDLELALERWGEHLDLGAVPPGFAALRLALLCGAGQLPRDPIPTSTEAAVAWESIDAASPGEDAWRELPTALLRSGAAVLWAARKAPAAGLVARRWMRGELDDDATLRELALLGAPVPSRALREAQDREAARREAVAKRRALEDEALRLAARREAARAALEHEVDRLAASQTSVRESAALEAARHAVAQELAALRDDRDRARDALAHALARAEVEREATASTRRREAAEAELARQLAAAEQRDALASAMRERDEARVAAEQSATALLVHRAKQRALEAELDAESARRRVAEARLTDASVDAALEALAHKDSERIEALKRLREAEVALREEDARQRRAAKEIEAEAARASERARRSLDEARAAEAEARAQERQRAEALRSYDEGAEAEARDAAAREARRAQEAAAEAEAARRALERREEEIARAWTEARRAAEEEIERLTDALRGVETEAKALELPEEHAPVEDPFAALAGALEAEGEGIDDLGLEDDLADLDAPRQEYALDLLAESYEASDDASLQRLRAAVDRWARRRPAHPWADLASRMRPRAVELIPAFEVHVTTRFETRACVESTGVAEGALPVPGEARGPDGALDPWALELPPSDPWSPWEAELPLDLPATESPCAACAEHEPAGRVPCASCDARGTTACARCEGWGRVTCPRCVGGGEVATATGTERCPRCEGRRTIACEACTLGRVPCAPCAGEGARPCAACDGRGARRVGQALRVMSVPVTALSVVAEGLPAEVRAEVRARDAESAPVVYVEAAEIDVAEVVREIPHRALAEAVGAALAAERDGAEGGRRPTRQRLVVRRYAVWRAEVEVEGRAHTLWTHGARGEVFTDDSPLTRWLDERVSEAREAIERDDLATAADRLLAVMAADLDHEGARAAARALGEHVRAQALRGELFEARENATRAAALRWPECLAPLAEAERILGRRLSQRASWTIVDEARAALERDRLERCADRLRELGAAEPDHPDGAELAAALGLKLAQLTRARVARGELNEAAAQLESVAALPFPQAAEALSSARVELATARRRAGLRSAAPWVIAAAAVLAMLLTLLSR